MFTTIDHINIRHDTNVTQIHFDQLNVIPHQHNAVHIVRNAWIHPHNTPSISDDMIFATMHRGYINLRLTRVFFKQ